MGAGDQGRGHQHQGITHPPCAEPAWGMPRRPCSRRLKGANTLLTERERNVERRCRRAGEDCLRARRADPARDLLYGHLGRGLHRFERGLEMADCDLPDRRGAVRPHRRGADRDRELRAADRGLRGLSYGAARRARDARLLAGGLAVDAAGRLQPDAARRRDRDHVLLADLRDARLGLFPAREGRPDALDRAAGRLPRRAGDREPGRRQLRPGIGL